jgi:hypothetical protein
LNSVNPGFHSTKPLYILLELPGDKEIQSVDFGDLAEKQDPESYYCNSANESIIRLKCDGNAPFGVCAQYYTILALTGTVAKSFVRSRGCESVEKSSRASSFNGLILTQSVMHTLLPSPNRRSLHPTK